MTTRALRCLSILALAALAAACSEDGADATPDARTDLGPDSAVDAGADGQVEPDANDRDVPHDSAADLSDVTDPDGGPDLGQDTADDIAPHDGHDASDTLSWVPKCDTEPCPIVIASFPYQDTRDTTDGLAWSRFDRYSCAPATNESGPEHLYVFRVDEPGTLIAGVSDGANVDIDVHLLDGHDPETCLARGHIGLSRHIEPGTYFLVADSWVNGSGVAQAGAYTLTAFFLPDSGACGMASEALGRIGTTQLLEMPATGAIVKEAHLVTAEETSRFPSGWPTSITDGIAAHYALSESVSGYVMDRTEPWAPCCEPNNAYGQGSSVPPPAEAEAWYVNMRWSSAPPRGQRYLVFNPLTGAAVVGAAGYENGPGDLSRVGGVSEEVHHALGSGHLDHLTFGVALDQTLPYGPIDCLTR